MYSGLVHIKHLQQFELTMDLVLASEAYPAVRRCNRFAMEIEASKCDLALTRAGRSDQLKHFRGRARQNYREDFRASQIPLLHRRRRGRMREKKFREASAHADGVVSLSVLLIGNHPASRLRLRGIS